SFLEHSCKDGERRSSLCGGTISLRLLRSCLRRYRNPPRHSHFQSPSGRDGLDILVRVDGELLGILVEPRTSDRGALHAALAVALASELGPDDAIDVVVVRLGGRGLAEAGLDVAPFLAGVGEGDA